MSNDHTPTPWRRLNGEGNGFQITSNNGLRKIAVTTWDDAIAEDNANAAFIVQACNSHAALVSALRECIAELDALFPQPYTGQHPAIQTLISARTALAQAGH